MQKILDLKVFGTFIMCFGVALSVMAAGENYGAAGASELTDKKLTLSKMLDFALEDEYLARGEYQNVIEKFGDRRPFSNIIKAEEKHISWLKLLLTDYGLALPPDRGSELAKVAATFADTFQIGIDAEVANISMYERFLKQDLPEDVMDVFNRLLAGSKRHLAAFKKRAGRSK